MAASGQNISSKELNHQEESQKIEQVQNMETSIAILTQNLIAETETEIKGNNPKFNYRMLTPGSQI